MQCRSIWWLGWWWDTRRSGDRVECGLIRGWWESGAETLYKGQSEGWHVPQNSSGTNRRIIALSVHGMLWGWKCYPWFSCRNWIPYCPYVRVQPASRKPTSEIVISYLDGFKVHFHCQLIFASSLSGLSNLSGLALMPSYRGVYATEYSTECFNNAVPGYHTPNAMMHPWPR